MKDQEEFTQNIDEHVSSQPSQNAHLHHAQAESLESPRAAPLAAQHAQATAQALQGALRKADSSPVRTRVIDRSTRRTLAGADERRPRTSGTARLGQGGIQVGSGVKKRVARWRCFLVLSAGGR